MKAQLIITTSLISQFILTAHAEPGEVELSVLKHAVSDVKRPPILSFTPYSQLSEKEIRLGYLDGPIIDRGLNIPLWLEPSLKIKPWFDDAHNKITEALSRKNAPYLDGSAVVFLITPNGTTSDAFVYRSKSIDTDKSALTLIKEIKYSAPSPEMCGVRIKVEFVKNSPKLSVDIKDGDIIGTHKSCP